MRVVRAAIWRTSSRATRTRRLLGPGEAARDLPQPLAGVQRPGRDLELGPEVVQMPAQPLLVGRACRDQILAMVDEQANVERRAVQVRAGKVLDPFLQRGASDAERVDRVRLAALAR